MRKERIAVAHAPNLRPNRGAWRWFVAQRTVLVALPAAMGSDDASTTYHVVVSGLRSRVRQVQNATARGGPTAWPFATSIAVRLTGARVPLPPCFPLLICCWVPIAAAQGAPPVAVTAARMLDVASGTMVADAVILVSGDRIIAAGTRQGTPIDANTRRIELGDVTLLPGLIDAHVHLTVAGTPQVNAETTLRAGFTSVMDLGAIGSANVDLRDSINAGTWVGPRMLSSGQWLGRTGMTCDFNGIGVHSAAEMVQRVRNDIGRRADVMKVCMTGWVSDAVQRPDEQEFSVQELSEVVRLSRAAGIPVFSHAIGVGGARASVRAGVTALAHAAFLDDSTIRLMRDRGVFLISTLHALKTRSDSTAFRALWARMQAVRAAGVQIIFGTDAGVIPHGTNADEFELLVRLGMTPSEAIRSATIDASRALRLDDEVGTLSSGKLADIIAVRGDPLKDISALRDVRFVMRGGVVVTR